MERLKKWFSVIKNLNLEVVVVEDLISARNKANS